MIRMHNAPMSTLLSPAFCEDELENIDVLRTTETDLDFNRTRLIEDVWAGHNSDERPLQDADGRALTWTDVTKFKRVMPPCSGGSWGGRSDCKRQGGRATSLLTNGTAYQRKTRSLQMSGTTAWQHR